MAATLKKGTSKSRRNTRRSHLQRIANELVSISKCSNCNVLKTPHKTCWNCGFYKGKLVKKAL